MYVVQPSSVPVDRRTRRAKSDGIDSELLLRTLLAWLRGEPRVCSMAPVPDEADEDAQRCVRERSELISERVGLTIADLEGSSFHRASSDATKATTQTGSELFWQRLA
jgi:transposase